MKRAGDSSDTQQRRGARVPQLSYVVAGIVSGAESLTYAIIGVLVFGWKRGGGVIPMMVLASVMGATWRLSTKPKVSSEDRESQRQQAGQPEGPPAPPPPDPPILPTPSKENMLTTEGRLARGERELAEKAQLEGLAQPEAGVADEACARAFTLMDENGKPRAWRIAHKDGPGLALYDQNEKRIWYAP